MGKLAAAGLSWFLLALGLAACGDCHDNDDAANAFLAARENRTCQSNADCVVVSTGCAVFERSYCGQATLNATAAKSSRWQELQQQLSDCDDSSCVVCAAALIPACSEGLCGKP